MNRFFILLFFVVCAFTSFGQRSYKPSKIGETKEFIGKIDMASQFDYDATFSINDSKFRYERIFLFSKWLLLPW
jgi:hypothetical protein